MEETEPVVPLVLTSNEHKKKKKKTKIKVKRPPKPKSTKEEIEKSDEKTTEEDSKIRRSSRIKTLETRRGSLKRREVVFSTTNLEKVNSNPSISNSSIADDDSNSNSSNSIQPGITSSISTPNLLISTEFLSSPPRDNPGLSVSPSLSPASLLKLKSRWRHSADAESSLFVNGGDSSLGSSVDADMNSLSLSEFQPTEHVFEPTSNLLRKSGSILYDPSDTELTEKLSKFQGLDENLFRSAERTISRESRGMLCDCVLSDGEIIGCNEDCLNRIILVECGSRCPTGDRCTNKKFQKREYCSLEIFKTEKKGHGLRTLQTVPRGGFVIEYVGEVLNPREFDRRTMEYANENQEHFYFMALKSDSIIDATQRGNCSRFINHSCEPNCETQKWTVNGELRIGFFTIRDLVAGDEITFDYQFQRYGKEAQKCFCMSPGCRGWIGGDGDEEEDDENEVEEDDKEEQEEAVVKPKIKRKVVRKRKKIKAVLEDVAFEEELSKLASTGLRNKIHTLTLCRLMVRAENWDVRERILNILIQGDAPCRRLFLDYHGLRLIWGWMIALPLPTHDSENTSISNDTYHKLFLKTLHSLPIPNKSLLQDSKVLSTVEKWSLAPAVSTRILKTVKAEVSEATSSDSIVLTPTPTSSTDPPAPPSTQQEQEPESTVDIQTDELLPVHIKQEPIDTDTISIDLANNSLFSGETDNEERESDESVVQEIIWEFVHGAKDLLLSWSGLQEVFRIPKKERVEQMKEHEREADKADRQRTESDRERLNSYDRNSKYRNRIDPRRLPTLIHHHNERVRDTYRNRASLNSFISENPNMSKEEKRNLFAARVAKAEAEERNRRMTDEMVSLHQERCARLCLDATTTPIVDPSCSYYLDPSSVSWKEINLEDPNLPQGLHIIVQSAQFPPPPPMVYSDPIPEIQTPEEELFPPWPIGLPPPPPLPPTVLPKHWKMHVDEEGRCYYYETRTRQSQWTPPSPDSEVISESEESAEETDEESEGQAVTTSGDEGTLSPRQELEEQAQAVQKFHSWMTDRAERRKRSGLVTERIISPRSEEERSCFVSQKSIRENKLQQLERKLKEVAEVEIVDSSEPHDVEVYTTQGDGLAPRENSKEVDDESAVGILTSPSTLPQKRNEKTREKVSSPGGEEKSSGANTKSTEPPQDPLLPDIEQLKLTESVEPERRETIPGLEDTVPSSGDGRESPTTTTLLSIVNSPAIVSTTTSTSRPKSSHERSAKKKVQRKSKHGERKAASGSSSKEREKEKMISDRKTKAVSMDNFRSQIANIIVQHLNPYRKPNCKNGHITSTEDFKHLARKMTHSITLKELKHCRDGKTLIVSESVKHKTKEFVKKYMARFNGPYTKSSDDSQM